MIIITATINIMVEFASKLLVKLNVFDAKEFKSVFKLDIVLYIILIFIISNLLFLSFSL
jgi:hypothetical protein